MKTIKSIKDLRTEVRVYKAMGLSVGFIPTMGALHEGHLSLVRQSNEENDISIVSIFVNPTQFNDKKDFENYPNSLETDKALLESESAALLFNPEYGDLYPGGYRYKVTENQFSNELCGAHRPGHFDGVLTVVLKLLNLAEADRAYFGEKDFQQLSLIKGMAEALFLKTEIIACPTVREEDGLAMSSRNSRLTKQQREMAKEFPKILRDQTLTNELRALELAKLGFGVDYVTDRDDRRFGAVKLGEIRLIDNIPIEGKNEPKNSF